MLPSAATSILSVRVSLPLSLAFDFRPRLLHPLLIVALLLGVQFGSQFAHETTEQAATGLFQRLQGP